VRGKEKEKEGMREKNRGRGEPFLPALPQAQRTLSIQTLKNSACAPCFCVASYRGKREEKESLSFHSISIKKHLSRCCDLVVVDIRPHRLLLLFVTRNS